MTRIFNLQSLRRKSVTFYHLGLFFIVNDTLSPYSVTKESKGLLFNLQCFAKPYIYLGCHPFSIFTSIEFYDFAVVGLV